MKRRDIAENEEMIGVAKAACVFSEDVFHAVYLDYCEMSAV